MAVESRDEAPSADTLVENTLAIVVESLDQLVTSPKTRELHGRARSFKRVLDRWSASPPTDEQRAALRDLVVQLHTDTMAHEKLQKSYRSIRVGAQESGVHVTAEGAAAQGRSKGARGR